MTPTTTPPHTRQLLGSDGASHHETCSYYWRSGPNILVEHWGSWTTRTPAEVLTDLRAQETRLAAFPDIPGSSTPESLSNIRKVIRKIESMEAGK